MSVAARPTAKRPKPRRNYRARYAAGLLLGLSLLAAGWTTLHHRSHAAPDAAAKAAVASPAPTATRMQPANHTDPALNQLLATWAGQQSFHTSVVATELTGAQRSASYQAADSIVPASTYKVYVAYAVLHGIEQGKYSLVTKTEDGNSIQTDLSNMILNSDNDAARSLGFLYGWKNINALLQAQGVTATNLYNYVPPSTSPVGDKHTTAGDLAAILSKLQAGALLNQSHTALLLGLMKQQHYRERIPAGVPSSVVVADKPGWLGPADGEAGYTQNDAAIIYGPKSTYLLVIATTGSSTRPLASLSQQVYDYLER
jgi:beta-lactamase class A